MTSNDPAPVLNLWDLMGSLGIFEQISAVQSVDSSHNFFLFCNPFCIVVEFWTLFRQLSFCVFLLLLTLADNANFQLVIGSTQALGTKEFYHSKGRTAAADRWRKKRKNLRKQKKNQNFSPLIICWIKASKSFSAAIITERWRAKARKKKTTSRNRRRHKLIRWPREWTNFEWDWGPQIDVSGRLMFCRIFEWILRTFSQFNCNAPAASGLAAANKQSDIQIRHKWIIVCAATTSSQSRTLRIF